MEETTSPNLLHEIEQEIYLDPVTKNIRFANYIIDVIVFYVLMFGVGIIWGLALVSQGSDIEDSAFVQESVDSTLLSYLYSIMFFVAYYTIMEAATKGRTIGKMITGTVAVREDGSNLTWKDALLRSLSRVVPFEPFSAFGGGLWHDSWTKTLVVKKTR